MPALSVSPDSHSSDLDLQSPLFGKIADNARASLPASAHGIANQLVAAVLSWTHPHKIARFAAHFHQRAQQLTVGYDASAVDHICVDMICILAQSLGDRLLMHNIPARVRGNYPAAVQRLILFLQQIDRPAYAFSSDYFIKDIRFVALLTLPCHAEVLDLRSHLGPHIAGKFFLQWPGLSTVCDLMKRRAWLAYHTEARYLDEFTPEGWNQCYLDAVALLERFDDIQGLYAVTWFVDPSLSAISPHLAYISDVPKQFGASIIPIRSTATDIAYATATSATRKRLYLEGRYLPKSHAIVWPRDGMLKWAQAYA